MIAERTPCSNDLSVKRHYYQVLTPLAYVRPAILSSSFSDIRDYSCSGHGHPFGSLPGDATIALKGYQGRTNPANNIREDVLGYDLFAIVQGGTIAVSPPPFLNTLVNPYNIGGLAIPKFQILTTWPLNPGYSCP